MNKHSTDRSISFAIIKGGQLRLLFNLNVSSERVRVRVRVGPGWQEEIGLTAADLVTMQTEYAKTSAALQKRVVEAGGYVVCACTRTILACNRTGIYLLRHSDSVGSTLNKRGGCMRSVGA